MVGMFGVTNVRGKLIMPGGIYKHRKGYHITEEHISANV